MCIKQHYKMHYELFECHIVPFVLTNASGVFMRVVNWLFEDPLDQGAIVSLDSILIYSTTA